MRRCLSKHWNSLQKAAFGAYAPPVDKSQTLKEAIRAEAERLGFAACGFARADAADAGGARLQALARGGHHGTMGWMEARADHRVSPSGLWPGARSAIALGMSYAPATDPMALAAETERGRISVYAQGGDYHKTVKKALKALARFIVDRSPSELKVFVDTAPVMEKPLAAAAGIGWQGKHTNLVSREHGSWLFLGVILTELCWSRMRRPNRGSIAEAARAASRRARRRQLGRPTGSMRASASRT
jgi:epoxyqueuosine reductase